MRKWIADFVLENHTSLLLTMTNSAPGMLKQTFKIESCLVKANMSIEDIVNGMRGICFSM
jgi:hypothetical protein